MIDKSDIEPCMCGSVEVSFIKEPMSCETYIRCKECGHQGEGGIYDMGALYAWNEEMANI